MKQWIRKIFGFGLASFFSDFSHEMTLSFIPILVTQFVGQSRAPFFLGLIASLTGIFASFLRIFSGFLADKFYHKKPLIALGYGISALFSTLVGFAHSVAGIVLYRILSFAGSGLREPPRDALIAATIEPADYGKAFGLKNAMDTAGALIGPLVALVCAKLFSIKTIFALSLIPGVLAVIAIILFTEDISTRKTVSKIPPTFWKEITLLPRSFIMFCAIMFIFHLGNFDKLLLLMRTQEIISYPKQDLVLLLVFLYALFNFVRASSEFLIGYLSDYLNRIILLALFGCGTFAAVGFLLITPHASLTYCSCVFALAGISSATVLTLTKACAADMLPEDVRGIGYGVFQATEGIAILISNILIGFLWSHFSPLLGFSLPIATSFITLLLLIIFKITFLLANKSQD
jgi:MFS family permease